VAPATDRPAAALDGTDAVLFDLDGVLTPTAVVHMHAWARLFAPLLDERGAAPYSDADYFAHIDGRPRYDGVASLLASRGIELPWGEPADSPDAATVCGLGNRKNAVFTQVLETEGVTPYPGSVRLVDALIADGRAVAVVSSSRNAVPVLAAAGLADRFEVVVDGLVAAERGLPGKPAPDTYLDAARQLGVPRERAVVVEDAESGVASGRAGEFGLVVGVDRGAGPDALRAHGADLVVEDLAELVTAQHDTGSQQP
jgi:beta-phosphoglucomutase family hydrolase